MPRHNAPPSDMPAASRHLFLDNQSRSRLAVIGLSCALAVRVVDIGFYSWLLANVGKIEDTTFAESLESLLGIAHLTVVVSCGIVFIRWFRRAYGNAFAIGLKSSIGLGWAIGAWFTPIANLYVPAQIAGAMWRQAGRDRVGSGAIIGAWWALWISGVFTDRLSAGMMVSAGDRGQVVDVLQVTIAGDVLAVLAAVLAIKLVRRLTKAQDEMQLLARADEAFGEEPPPLPAGMPSAPPVIVSTVPGERPVAGSACGHCGARVDTDYDAFVCRDCDMPLHEDCLREGACPQCRGRDLDAGFRFY